ncbi:metallophosphatase family protein [Spirillospora sp. NBC_00431]
MRLGILGDVHCDDVVLAQAIERVRTARVDEIVCVGDIADGRGSFDNCCELLRSHGVQTVRGNHDRWLLEGKYRGPGPATKPADVAPASMAFLAGLPPTRTLDTPAGPLLVCHGLGDNDLFKLPTGEPTPEVAAEMDAFVASTDAKWVVNGHTHRPLVRAWREVVFINAGTLRRGHDPVVLLLDLRTQHITCLALDGGGADVRESSWTMAEAQAAERLYP